MVTRSDKLRAGNYPSCGISILLPVHRWAVCDSRCCGTGSCLPGSGEDREVCCFGRAHPSSRTAGFALPAQRQPGCGAALRAHTAWVGTCGVHGGVHEGTGGYMEASATLPGWWCAGLRVSFSLSSPWHGFHRYLIPVSFPNKEEQLELLIKKPGQHRVCKSR